MNTTTQVCPKCPEKGEQPMSSFHRRRDGYQKICKACRNLAAKADYQTRGKTRKTPSPIQPIDTDNFPALSERIVALESYLRSLARSFAHDGLEADDIYAAEVEAILTRCKPEDDDGYMMRKALWTARSYVAKQLTYDHYIVGYDMSDVPDYDGGDVVVSDQSVFSVGTSQSVEKEMIILEDSAKIAKILKTLPAENQRVIALIAVGMNQKQIAAELQVSEQTISERMKKMREMLRGMMAPEMGLAFG